MSNLRDLKIGVGFDGAGAVRGLEGLNRQIDNTKAGLTRVDPALGRMGATFETRMEGLDKQFQLWERNSDAFTSGLERKGRQIDLVSNRSSLLENEIASTRSELATVNSTFGQGTEAAARLENQLADLEIQLADNRAELNRLQSFDWGAFERVGQGFTNIGKSWSMAVTAPLVAIGGLGLRTSILLEDSWARVEKVTNGTEEELQQIRSQLRYLATDGGIPLAITDMYELGTAAGRVGIELENMTLAVSTAAMLGTVSNLTADAAMDKMAQFATVMQMPQENFDRLGSTLVGLGNNLATTENDIMRMGARLTGMGNAVGLTEYEVLGFSAAFSAMGISAEAGSTAFTNVMLGINDAFFEGHDALEIFANTAEMYVGDFAKLWERDAASAVTYMIEGLGRLNDQGYNINAIMSEMGFEGVNITDILRRASGSGDMLRETLGLAGAAWSENSALTEAAGKIYNTTAADIQLFRNRLTLLKDTIGQDLQEQFRGLINVGSRLLGWLEGMDDGTRRTVMGIAMVAAAIGPLLLGIGGAIKLVVRMRETVFQLRKGFYALKFAMSKDGMKLWGAKVKANTIKLGSFIKKKAVAVKSFGLKTVAIAKNTATWIKNTVAIGKQKIATGISIVKQKAQIGVTKGVTAVQLLFNKALMANPIGLVIGLIVGLIAIGVALWRNWDTITEKLGLFWYNVKSFFDMISNWIIDKVSIALNFLSERFPATFEFLTTHFGIFKDMIVGVFSGIKQIFGGIIDFIAGIFTGDWERAWYGVVNIFGGIFGTLGSLVKAPINGVINIVNAAIRGINGISIDIPEWVPFVGGRNFGVTIPEIPMLATGTNFHQGGPAIVGEEGPELVIMPRGTKVIPNDKSMGLLKQWKNEEQKQLELAALMGKEPRMVVADTMIETNSTKSVHATQIKPALGKNSTEIKQRKANLQGLGTMGRKNRPQTSDSYSFEKFDQNGCYINPKKQTENYPPTIKVIIQSLTVTGDGEMSESTYNKLVEKLKEVFKEVFGELWEDEWYKLSLAYPNITEL